MRECGFAGTLVKRLMDLCLSKPSFYSSFNTVNMEMMMMLLMMMMMIMMMMELIVIKQRTISCDNKVGP